MPDLRVSSFARGLDTRRPEYAAPEGSLSEFLNGHVTRGGDVENRLAMVSTYTIPSGTYGLAQKSGNLYVFGSGTDPGVPSGITYQRLQDGGGNNMTEVLDWDLFNQKLYVVAAFDDGSIHHFYDGTRVSDIFDGKARTSFTVTGGSSNPGTNDVDAILVNGVDILGAAVNWVTSNAATATAIAAQINSNTSSPDYSAVASDVQVTIISDTAGTTPNGYAVSVTIAAGDVTVSTPAALSGGADNAPGDPGSTVRTHEDKMYTIASPNMNFSEIENPTEYNPPALGAGFINIASHSTDASDPKVVESFLNFIAAFAERAIQIWDVDPDPENYDLFQVLRNAGTKAPKSVLAREDGDVFFLDESGIRSLRVRDSSNKAYVFEAGAPIDKEVGEQIDAVSAATLADAVAVVEPRDKRFWLALGDTVYVYSYYPSAQIAAWSIYQFGFTIKDFCVVGRKLYARSGNTVYLYGGADFDTYGADYTTTVRIPYLDANRPDGYKDLQGIDVGLTGEWTVSIGQALEDNSVLEEVGKFTQSTYDQNSIGVAGRSSHITIRAQHTKAERALLSEFVLHYATDDTDRT